MISEPPTGSKQNVDEYPTMLDPRGVAELDLGQIWAMVSEMIAAQSEWLPKGNQAETLWEIRA